MAPPRESHAGQRTKTSVEKSKVYSLGFANKHLKLVLQTSKVLPRQLFDSATPLIVIIGGIMKN